MKFVLLINLKLLISANSFLLNIAEHGNSSANKYDKSRLLSALSYLLAEKISCSAEICMKKRFHNTGTWPRGYNTVSCATQLSMKVSLLINTKMPTIVGIFVFISREKFMLSYV